MNSKKDVTISTLDTRSYILSAYDTREEVQHKYSFGGSSIRGINRQRDQTSGVSIVGGSSVEGSIVGESSVMGPYLEHYSDYAIHNSRGSRTFPSCGTLEWE